MTEQELERMLTRIAADHHTTSREVRREMEIAMEEAASNPDPVIQAQWDKIPRKGERITLEEFIQYVADVANNALR